MRDPSPKDNAERGYVVMHGFAQLLFWSAFYYLLPALSAPIVSATGWPVVHVSTTYTLAFIVWALSAPLVGALVDRGHGPQVIRIGAVLGVALLICLSQISNRWLFSAIVIALGACMASTLYDPCFAVIMQRLKHAGSNAVATVSLIAGFATLLTFPLVIALASNMSWQHIILLFAALAAVGVLLLPRGLGTKTKPNQRDEKFPLEPASVLIAISFGLVMFGHSMLLFLLPVALDQVHGGNIALLALAILGPAQIAGRIAWKYFSDSISYQTCAIVMFAALCVPATLLLVLGTNASILYTALIVQGACYGVHTILRPSLAQLYLSPEHLGRGFGFIAMVGLFLMAIGPAVGGIIWTISGISGLLGAVLLANLLALLLGARLRIMTVRKQ